MSNLNMTSSTFGIAALVIFILAYALVIAEEFIHLRKSKPVLLAAGLIWILVALLAKSKAQGKELLEHAIQHNLLEYAALLLFLLTAMIYVNAMTERNVFQALRAWLVKKGYSYKKLFWITGFLAFFISPVADNLTTALLMGAVVLAVGSDKPKFVSIAFINIVVAANAGGAFSPFGDITTLMVWQSGHIDFFGFFALFIPSLINFILPASIMSFAIPNETPKGTNETVQLKQGAVPICLLFLCTIITAVTFEQFLHLPPFLGMMMGLSYLFFFSYYLKISGRRSAENIGEFNIFNKVARAEWDTLLFFFGVIFCVGGLGTIGYLAYVSHFLYDGFGPTNANVIAGVLSAIVDNIPVMFAILTMNPQMSDFQWLLVTMTAGVGGSLLSVGSAAGVALMGQSKGMYSFFSHLKWSWAIALGYVASIYSHFLLNG
ncbi:sodium:proton antiporter NhaD [Thalassotalea sp. G2M2-11]|uniref:sodium:proton antiporter NhaD n=1 Tax=Thalassotalea sp. G2M2-11 TaxID=2787627 RepID=UPI0019D1FDBC|nr:sodium:proton antiporter NhaD [Thalassotalea sp. G2M2-11]